MKPRSKLLLSVLLIGWMCAVDAQPSSLLQAAMRYELESESYYIDLVNESRQFLCIPEDAFDTRRGYVSLLRQSGEEIPLKSHADSAPILYQGVDIARAFIFLRPGERRKMYLDMNNFVTDKREAALEYKIVFPYYICKDIIQTEDLAKDGVIPTRAIDVTGKVPSASATK